MNSNLLSKLAAPASPKGLKSPAALGVLLAAGAGLYLAEEFDLLPPGAVEFLGLKIDPGVQGYFDNLKSQGKPIMAGGNYMLGGYFTNTGTLWNAYGHPTWKALPAFNSMPPNYLYYRGWNGPAYAPIYYEWFVPNGTNPYYGYKFGTIYQPTLPASLADAISNPMLSPVADPVFTPIGDPALAKEEAKKGFYVWIEGVELPGVHPHANISVNPTPASAPATAPAASLYGSVEIGPPDLAPVQLVWFGKPSGPKSKQKTKKKNDKGFKSLTVVGQITESLDFMECVFSSTNIHGGGWTGHNVLTPFKGWKYGSWTAKASAWYKFMESGKGSIDPDKLAQCLFANEIEDTFIGKLSKKVASAYNPRPGVGIGLQTGPVL